MLRNRRFHARTAIFGKLLRILSIAKHAVSADRTVDDVVGKDKLDVRFDRRRFLQVSLGTAVALSVFDRAALAAPKATAPRIVIVGAGIAGLSAAYRLQKAGVPAEVYEASGRTGGRIFSRKDVLAPGLVTELGAEFIDSTHKDMLAYAKEFGLGLMDRDTPDETKFKQTYFFGGEHHTEKQMAEAFVPLLKRIAADSARVGGSVAFDHPGVAKKLDHTSLDDYLTHIGVTGWLRQFIEVAYVTEFGLELQEQSSLNFIDLVQKEVSDKFWIFGESDERYKISGGNQSVTDALAIRINDQLHLMHTLASVRQRGHGFELTFFSPTGTKEVKADVVIMTLPFSVLRTIPLKMDLPPVKKAVIQELGYGTNAKILLGTQKRVWREQGYSGEVFSDEPFQLAWDNSQAQTGESGGVTFFYGGRRGLDCAKGTPTEAAADSVAGYDKVFPGFKGALNGQIARFHWPSYEFSKGSYACYLVGQWTTLSGAESLPIGNFYFAGEHCSADFQGMMNGGAETGRRAAEAILKKLKRRFLS